MAEKASWIEWIKQVRDSLGISDATPAHIQLKRVRERLNLTQEKLAEKLEVDTGTISRWETRARKLPSHKQRRKMQNILGIPIHVWREETEQINSNYNHIPTQLSQGSSPQDKLFPPIWHVPYDRNPYFTDQRNLVQHLRERMTVGDIGATHQAISGLGGIGKTQLALEYAYQYQSTYTAVLWAGASTQTQLFKDFASIAMLLQVPEAQKTEPRQRYLINEVLDWLQTRDGWLLVLDNMEEGLDEKDADNVEESLKVDRILVMLKKGHILLTTRSQSVARLVQNFLLEEMQLEEAAQLLLLRNNQPSSPEVLSAADETRREGALSVARLLAGLPLALEQARAYIEATGCGFAGYRQLYEEYRQDLLASVAKGSRLAKEYQESVATTWLISFRHVEQRFAVAADVLKLCAYLAPDAIPEDIILKGAEKLDSSLQLLAGNRFQFNQACQILLNYSLIKRNAEGVVLSIHRLIQAVLQDRMDDENQRLWAKLAVQAVEHTFLSALSTQQNIDQYLPHVRLCATFIKKLKLEGQEVAHLLELGAKEVYARGWYAQARPLSLRAYGAAKDLLGEKDPHVLSLLLDVARVHMDLGASPLAARIYQRVKENFEQLFGPDDPEVVICLNNQAVAQINMGNLLEAEQTCKVALAWYKHGRTSEGAHHATTYEIAARVSVSLRQLHRAEAYYKAALEIRRQVFGVDHLEVAKSSVYLGIFYVFHIKRLEQAEPLLRQALEIRQRILGSDHPDAAESLVYLANLYWEQKNFEEAERCYQQALAIRRQKLGPYHPGIVHILHDLAVLTAEQRRDEEAEQYFHEVLAIAPHAVGTETYEHALLLEAYVDFLRGRGRMGEVEEYNKQITKLVKRLQTRGPLHTLKFSDVDEEGQEITSAQMWFFERGSRNES